MEAVLGRRATQADGSSAEVTDGEEGAAAAIPMDGQGDQVAAVGEDGGAGAVEGEGPLGIQYEVHLKWKFYNDFILKQLFCIH